MYYISATRRGIDLQKKKSFKLYDVFNTARLRVRGVFTRDFLSRTLKIMLSKPFLIENALNKDS